MSELQKSLPNELQDAQLFAERLLSVYGDAAAEIIDELAGANDLSYWINPLVEQEFAPLGQPVAGMAGMWSLPRNSDFTNHPAATAGKVYIQNPSSLLAVRVLDPQPEEEVLDLAAAPGGKTIAMAAAMANTGRIAAVEPVKGRFHRLRANLARCGVTNAALYQRDGRGVGKAVPARFDRVLLDAPCSSEARMRWDDPASFKHWSRRKVKETQRKQKSLLRSAYAALKPGGILVYCTCSFGVEENEAVVQHLLDKSDAQLMPITNAPSHSRPGVSHWQGKALAEAMAQTLRILPRGVWDGFYIARLTKPA